MVVVGNKNKPKFKEMNKELRDLTFYKCSDDEKDKLERIHTLLNEGADVDFAGPHGDTALHKAADRYIYTHTHTHTHTLYIYIYTYTNEANFH